MATARAFELTDLVAGALQLELHRGTTAGERLPNWG